MQCPRAHHTTFCTRARSLVPDQQDVPPLVRTCLPRGQVQRSPYTLYTRVYRYGPVIPCVVTPVAAMCPRGVRRRRGTSDVGGGERRRRESASDRRERLVRARSRITRGAPAGARGDGDGVAEEEKTVHKIYIIRVYTERKKKKKKKTSANIFNCCVFVRVRVYVRRACVYETR